MMHTKTMPYQPPKAGPEAVNRRHFLQLMGASLALAGLSACRRPAETIVPYVRPPEEIVPGEPLFFATAVLRGGFATGVLVESHTGRPTKIEGNPLHPASLGATDALTQAEILNLYDPDRSQVVRQAGQISTWSAFLSALKPMLDRQRTKQGTGVRILTETVTSPTLAHQLQTVLETFPDAKWHQYEPIGRDHTRAGAHLAFGQFVETHYDFSQAEVVLALDADFLFAMPGSVRYARALSTARQAETGCMNRLYVAESTPSVTGAAADHRLPLLPGAIEQLAFAVAERFGIREWGMGSRQEEGLPDIDANWLSAVLEDLQSQRGKSVVVVGEGQPPAVHMLGHGLNHVLSNVGTTVHYTDPVEARPVDQTDSLRELASDMEAGRVEVLLILGGNPVYTAPADFQFAEHLARVPFRVHLSQYNDETSTSCHWHIPEAHSLETWGDARAFDGTVSILQPLIAPLYGGKSAIEVLSSVTRLAGPSHAGESGGSGGYALVRDYWQTQTQAADFEIWWETALHDGLIADTAFPPKQLSLNRTSRRTLGLSSNPPRDWSPASDSHRLTLLFQPDPSIWDGRFANNGWLQELPKPLTKLTWDNAALISPATAEQLGLVNEQVVELHTASASVRAPIWIVPGQVDQAVSVSLGYGRTRTGKVGTGAGFNAYTLRTSRAGWATPECGLKKTAERFALSTTQQHHRMEGRDLVRTASLETFRQRLNFAQDQGRDQGASHPSLYPPVAYEGYAWGMVIDLNTCIGCNACVTACQAENNIPIVGKAQIALGREMHWIRVDHYSLGSDENPETVHQPVPCMHCENAPCEVVCPVGATVHSHEGLNDMVYNRCVGTRYCSNNCPYKVRRFNFLSYGQYDTDSAPVLQLLHNPDVSVRSRGVMEKCTYCVQRINATRITAKKEGRLIHDGEIVPACQQACPTQAIHFGDINNPESQVARLKANPRHYSLLAELNTRPRTTYLAKLRNSHPRLTRRTTRITDPEYDR